MAVGTMLQTSITDLLRQEHRRMKDLFGDFDNAGIEERKRIVREAMQVIRMHDFIEKKLLYPTALKAAGVSRELVLRCQEAHHVVNIVLAELKVLPYSDRYFAKFSKITEAIREHIREEEEELFPTLERSGVDLVDLGRRMQDLRESAIPGLPLAVTGSKTGLVAGIAAVVGLGWILYRALSSEEVYIEE